MNSLEIKTACLTWLRYARQIAYVADECGGGRWLADVVAIDGSDHLIEIEIKTSKYDFRRDFESKAPKHERYAASDFEHASIGRWCPHKMYFAVPESLEAEALSYLKEHFPLYGLLVAKENDGTYGTVPWKLLRAPRRAQLLHQRPLDPDIRWDIAKRMASDICQFHIMRQHYGGLFDHMQALSKKMSDEKESVAP